MPALAEQYTVIAPHIFYTSCCSALPYREVSLV